MRNHAQDSERHDPGPRRRVVADDHPPKAREAIRSATRGRCRANRVDRRPAVAAVHDLDRHIRGDDALDVRIRHRRRAAVDVPDDVRPGLEHRISGDRVRAGDGRTAGVERHGHPVLLRPRDHRRRLRAGLDAPEPDLADEPDPGLGHLGEVALHQPQLQDRRAAVDLHACGTEGGPRLRRHDRERLEPGDVLRAARKVDLAGRDDRRDPAMQARLDEALGLLARREVAEHRVRVGVDQARDRRRALRVDDLVDALGGQAAPHRLDSAVGDEDRIGVRERRIDVAGDDGADVANQGPHRNSRSLASPPGVG